MQLSSLALPPHPFAFSFVPDAPAMKEQEPLATAGHRSIDVVQSLNAFDGGGQQFLVIRKCFLASIDPVREQRKMQVARRIRQIMNLEPSQQFFDFVLSGEEC